MAGLMLNMVLQIEVDQFSGLFRLIAIPPGLDMVYLGGAGPTSSGTSQPSARAGKVTCIFRSLLEVWLEDGSARPVELTTGRKSRLSVDELSSSEKALFSYRRELMKAFLDHGALCEALLGPRRLGHLVRPAMEKHGCSRAVIYKLWRLLCLHGFELSSLHPRFDRCGAPGVNRPYQIGRPIVGPKPAKLKLGIPHDHPQAGVTESMRTRVVRVARPLMVPGRSFRNLYTRIVEACFVTQYVDVDGQRMPVPPAQGTYPTKRQVRHILDTEFTRLDRLRLRTTEGYYQRNLRGLHGKSYDGVPGPGHCYAIDSTVGDVFLRSSINRAWVIGRPIVYVIVDVWSTAVVGFHVCLQGPSWATASQAVFSVAASPDLLGELWSYRPIDTLSPAPTLPNSFMADRGEYLSAAALKCAEDLGFNWQINAAYRPDYKSIVEVLNRIAKDEQFSFVPGAINARRKELELRTDVRESVLTLHEYAHYLHGIFSEYNLVADRSHRLTAEMIAAGVGPSPAGLWRFGHHQGIGYQKTLPLERLITNLLPTHPAVVRRTGLYLGQLQYQSALMDEQQWTAHARNFGVMERTVHHFPGSTSRIWVPNEEAGCLDEMRLHPQARTSPDTSFDEWLDAYCYEKAKKPDRDHARLQFALQELVRARDLIAKATELTREAEQSYGGPDLSIREVRDIERTLRKGEGRSAAEAEASKVAPTERPEHAYEDLIREALRQASQEVPQ